MNVGEHELSAPLEMTPAPGASRSVIQVNQILVPTDSGFEMRPQMGGFMTLQLDSHTAHTSHATLEHRRAAMLTSCNRRSSQVNSVTGGPQKQLVQGAGGLLLRPTICTKCLATGIVQGELPE